MNYGDGVHLRKGRDKGVIMRKREEDPREAGGMNLHCQWTCPIARIALTLHATRTKEIIPVDAPCACKEKAYCILSRHFWVPKLSNVRIPSAWTRQAE